MSDTSEEMSAPATGRRVGDQPKPRALLAWDGPDRDKVAATLAAHAPTVREIASLREVRQTDYDVLVTNRMDSLLIRDSAGEAREPAAHLCVLSVASARPDAPFGSPTPYRNRPLRSHGATASSPSRSRYRPTCCPLLLSW